MNLDLREVLLSTSTLSLRKREMKMQTMLSACGFEQSFVLMLKSFRKTSCRMFPSHHIALNEVDVPFIVFEDDCVDINFEPVIEVPDDSDAVYLGISSWGRMNSHSGPCVQYQDIGNGMVRCIICLVPCYSLHECRVCISV